MKSVIRLFAVASVVAMSAVGCGGNEPEMQDGTDQFHASTFERLNPGQVPQVPSEESSKTAYVRTQCNAYQFAVAVLHCEENHSGADVYACDYDAATGTTYYAYAYSMPVRQASR